MAQEQQPHPEIIQPLERQPDALVENVYPMPETEQPDFESQDVMGEYLVQRFIPDEGPRTRVVLAESGRTLPGVSRVPAGFKEVTRWRKVRPKEWFISPKQALAVMLGTAALFNVIGDRESIKGGAEWVGHEVYRVFEPVGSTTEAKRTVVEVPGKQSRINVTADTADRAGAITISQTAIESFIHKVDTARQHGASITKIDVVGRTSDEWNGDASIGEKNEANVRLGEARATAALEALSADGFHIDSSKLARSQHEHVVSQQQKQALLKEAHADGYETIASAIQAVDAKESVPRRLAQKIRQLFVGKQNRGVALSATVEYPAVSTREVKTTHVEVAGKDHAPDVPTPGFFGFIPMFWFRRRERYSKIKEVKRWEFTPAKPIMRPELLREDADQVWVRLRPEAVRENGTLVEDAWAYSRDQELLFRDKRIADVLRADYKDTEGREKSLRVMFVDESPAQETVDAFEKLLQSFAAMEDGRIADRVTGIFVFPSENAGTDHGDPKRIGMGIDKQSPANILGTYTAALNMVQMHMPTTWSAEELLEAFSLYNGPGWVAAHEVAGHGTDDSDEPLHLRRILAHGIPQAHVIEGESHANKMQPLDEIIENLPESPDQQVTPIEFDIVYPVPDLNGRIVTVSARVAQGDPRLAHATQATIVGRRPTQYSGTNTAEHYAETAASLTTGISVPYPEAFVDVPELPTDDGHRAEFATSYRPDTRGQQIFTNSVGAQAGSFPTTFENPPEVTVVRTAPADDPFLRQHLARMSRLRTLRPEQMVAILARVSRSAK